MKFGNNFENKFLEKLSCGSFDNIKKGGLYRWIDTNFPQSLNRKISNELYMFEFGDIVNQIGEGVYKTLMNK